MSLSESDTQQDDHKRYGQLLSDRSSSQNQYEGTHKMGMPTPNIDNSWGYKIQRNVKQSVFYVVQQFLVLCILISKVLLTPILYPLYWALSLTLYAVRITKISVTFILQGVQGVFTTLSQVSFGQKLYYAVLKQNGLYLRVKGNTLEQIFTHQLYDYSIRKFMTMPNLQDDIKVAQIQPWSHVGLYYLKNSLGLNNLSFFQNSQQKIEKISSKMRDISPILTDYSSQAPKNPHDIFIVFNQDKDSESYEKYVDLIKIMSYIRRNLTQSGYVVFGNSFHSQGQIAVFQQLIQSFGFKISVSQNITSNILHSRKILQKTYRNRKIAWLKQQVKQLIRNIIKGDHRVGRLFQYIWSGIQKITGVKYGPTQYLIYILELNNI